MLKPHLHLLPHDVQQEEATGQAVAFQFRSSRNNTKVGLRRYSSHSGKRTFGTTKANAGCTIREIATDGRWRSEKVAAGYVNENGNRQAVAEEKHMKHLGLEKKEDKKRKRRHKQHKSHKRHKRHKKHKRHKYRKTKKNVIHVHIHDRSSSDSSDSTQ